MLPRFVARSFQQNPFLLVKLRLLSLRGTQISDKYVREPHNAAVSSNPFFFFFFFSLTISLTGKVLPIVHEVMSIMRMIHSIIRIHTYILN